MSEDKSAYEPQGGHRYLRLSSGANVTGDVGPSNGYSRRRDDVGDTRVVS